MNGVAAKIAGVKSARRKVVPGVTGRSVAKILRVLEKEAPRWNAPIVALAAQQNQSPFLTLIGCILSLRTKDQMTAVACERLFAEARTPEAMLAMTPAALEKLIYPVGFYRTKAKVIRGICRDLIDKFSGAVPDDIDDLLTLNGVGRKTANLVVTQAFRKPGICVDTHVHRISNRWGLVASKTPDKTELALREVLPRRHWIDYNTILVAFGQTLCQPVSPWCSRCPISTECPKIAVVHSR
jgi:endonuclease III